MDLQPHSTISVLMIGQIWAKPHAKIITYTSKIKGIEEPEQMHTYVECRLNPFFDEAL